MNAILSQLFIKLLSAFASWLIGRVSQEVQRQQKSSQTAEDVDAKLQKLKEAFTEARDGKEVTSEQRKKIQDAARDFIRNTNPGL